MKKAILKMLLFISPFIFVSGIVFLVDPYNLFNISHLFTDETKIKCYKRSNATCPRGAILWKTVEFERNPTPNILIGDSRLADISLPYLEEKLGGKTTLFAIQGGNYKSIIDLFWMTTKSVKLQNVIFQVCFNSYSAANNIDLYTPTRELIDNKYQYFLRSIYVKDCFSIIYYSISHNEKFVTQSYSSTSNNWDLTGKVLEGEYLQRKYVYPGLYYNELLKISKFCSKEGIKLIFVISPDYDKIKDFIKNANLENEYLRFKTDIKSLGTTVDLDNGIPFSLNKNNYFDYFHIKPQLVDSVITMIFKSDQINKKRL